MITLRKYSRLPWTPEGTTAFEHILLISRSPKLCFIHGTAPVMLMTDAFSYGVWAYSFKQVHGKQHLVALVSKALPHRQLRWSVFQEETYGKFHCCTLLGAMLGDRKFPSRTDRKNLLFIKHVSNPMVVRWWMALRN